ncbi:hypothetical protein B0H15DRAFT_803272 [Mycena belliarum]|uniref:Uncharacterized protein n=1 Tax=Mycena belliarum TaxID=1033014 RepID=A0AAD6XRH4_9AGAR|nr:hypothetical protein B0H15DRAFT_803272 [Mycena belliae]
MLWLPQERKTRSGARFSPLVPAAATALVSSTFDLAPLIHEALAREQDALDDIHDPLPAPSMDDVDDVDGGATSPSLADLDDVHETPPPASPRKSPRLQDIPRRSNLHRNAKRRDKRRISPLQRGAYSAKTDTPAEKKLARQEGRTLADFLAMGFTLVRWNGRDARPIVDSHGRIIAVLAGRPNDPTYDAAASEAFATLAAEAARPNFPLHMHHRRGAFPAVNAGIFYGQGTDRPCLLNNKAQSAMVARLLANPNFNRLASYADAAFAIWAPLIYKHYRDHDAALRTRYPNLRRNFVGSIFACAAFNFGPNAWTVKHRDVQNLAFGWCAVQSLGRFAPEHGGHLVLWDLMLVIEFPPGSTILLPSATISHSNLPVDVKAGEERASFTQYTPGALLRFIDNGFRTEAQFAKEDPAGYAQMCELKDSRCAAGVAIHGSILFPNPTPRPNQLPCPLILEADAAIELAHARASYYIYRRAVLQAPTPCLTLALHIRTRASLPPSTNPMHAQQVQNFNRRQQKKPREG